MPWISVSPVAPITSVLTRTARRATVNLLAHGRQLATIPPAPAANPIPSLTAAGDKVFTFCSVVLEYSKRPPSPAPKPGTRPRRPRPSSYNALMTAFSRSGEPDEVLRLFRELKRSHPKPSVISYNTLLNSLVVANRLEDVDDVFDEMVASGVARTAVSYTILLKVQSFHPHHVDLAYEIMRSMVRDGCKPDVITYSTLISVLCRAGRLQEAWGVLDKMLEENLHPTIVTYNCIVHGYCLEGRIMEAKRLMETMGMVGCPPDTVTYTSLIQALCETGDFGEVEKILGESDLKGWKPDSITYNVYMNGLCRCGKVDEAFQQLEVMRCSELAPDIVTLNILFDCLCRDSKIWEAMYLLGRSSELEWDVDAFSYTTLMSRLCELGEWSAILKLLADMLKRGISPSTCTFNVVIHSLCRAGELERAKCVIRSHGFKPNVVTFNTLLHGFYLAGEFDEVRLLFASMFEKNIAPNRFSYGIMIDSLCRQGKFLEAIDCFLISLEDGFSHNLVTCLIKRLIKGGKLRELLRLVEQILGRGLFLNVHVFNSLVRTFCRKGCCQRAEINTVCLILDKMLGMR